MFGRRNSIYQPANKGVEIAQIVLDGARAYLNEHPIKSIFHASQDIAKTIETFAQTAKNTFNADIGGLAAHLIALVDFLDQLENYLAMLTRENKQTLYKHILGHNQKLLDKIHAVIRNNLHDTEYTSIRDGITKMRTELGINEPQLTH